MTFVSDSQRRACFARLAGTDINGFSFKPVGAISLENRFSFKEDERKRAFYALPDVIKEVITSEDMFFYESSGHVSSRLAGKVAEILEEKHGFDIEGLYDTLHPGSSNRRLKLEIESVLDRGDFVSELENKGIYKSPDIDEMVKNAVKKLMEEDRFYGGNINSVVGDVCLEMDKVWDSKYGQRPCGPDIKKIVEKYYENEIQV